MFQFGRFALIVPCLQHGGLPHSEITGSSLICRSPALIAAYHVLHRLREPRHPPCTLYYFLPLMRLLRRMVCFFCSCHDVSFPMQDRESTNTTVAYCCLLFFFNFFQYVKELSLGGARNNEQGIKTWSFIFVLSSLFTEWWRITESNR